MALRIIFLLAVLLPHSLPAVERTFDVVGVIRGRLDDGRLIIEHEVIPDYMPAMTMAFEPADPAEAAVLAVGDKVRFRYRTGAGSALAESFVVTGHTAPVATAPACPVRRLREGDSVPPFRLVDETGHAFADRDLRGRFTVITFIFTRCPVPDYCPAMAVKFGVLQRALTEGKPAAVPVRLLSITLDPEFDVPDILTAYGSAIGAQPKVWNFATGEKEEISALARAFSVFTERNGATLDHTLCTALIGPDGRVIEIWRGNGWTTDEVLVAVRSPGER